jgi:tetratricopeptide (TPR) repeat protein
VAAADEDWCRAADHAARAEDEPAIFEILDWRASAALFGPTPVPQAIARCREICERVSDSPVAVARTARPLAALHAMAGDFDEAYRLVRVGDDLLGELGGLDSAITQQEGLVELLAGRPAAAEARLRRGYDRLEQMGEKALLATTAAMLAGALHAQGRRDEAAEFCLVSREAATEEDLAAQVGWRGVEAKLLAERGEVDEAETLAEEAVRLAEPTDCLSLRADALLDLGTVLRQAGRHERANTAIGDALELYRAKGDLVSAKRASSRLGTPAALGGANQRPEVRDVEVR